MADEVERPRPRRKRLVLAVLAVAFVLAILLVPPMLSIGRYKSRITQLVSSSLGRPVRLASVELRMLPRPEFVLTDLTVEEDPAYGAEPILHANTVTAAIRLLSLWRGRIEISSISVDEASLNVVRTGNNQWNLDPFFRTAAARSNGTAQGRVPPFPYLEATNSRVNVKDKLEKLPFSLVGADLSFWQESPGDWRLRLRGQPARTDVNLDLADTGIVRLEATLHRAPQLRQMPIHLQMEWREAQLGQLSRLLVGSDPGWRGDLTGQMQLDGTAEAAQVKTRLTATGVHRVEFAPADPLDFDANCTFVFRYSSRALDNLACDSPFGDGHVKLAGNLPANAPGRLAVEMQGIPVSAGLDVLRTLRSGFGQGLQARGTVSGQLTYDPAAAAAAKAAQQAPPVRRGLKKSKVAKARSTPQGPLFGSLTVDGFRLSGDSLSQPIQIAKMTIEPAAVADGLPQPLSTSISLPLGGASPVAITARFALSGYQMSIHGPATLVRIRELAHVAGMRDISAYDGIAGDPATLDLEAEGPWLPTPKAPLNNPGRPGSILSLEDALVLKDADSDQVSGTVTLHNANWKSDALANPVEIAQATLHLGSGAIVWDPVVFSYGPVKGTASLQAALECEPDQQCPPQLDLHFEELDTAAVQAALLGAHQQGTVLSTLIARFRPASAPLWPRLNGTVKADALILGPVTMQNAVISLRVLPTGAEFSSLDATLYGGQIHAAGKLANGDRPGYTFEGNFAKLNPAPVCRIFALRCAGGPIDGNGKIAVAGFTDQDLTASAAGSLHFEWRHGAIDAAHTAQAPKALSRFDDWTADAAIAHGALSLTQNELRRAGRQASIDAAVHFGENPSATFAPPKPTQSAKR